MDIKELPWRVIHKETTKQGTMWHLAWYQRSLHVGDFAPGRQPSAMHVVGSDGKALYPYDSPKCETCGNVPDINHLEVEEIATGQQFLQAFRDGYRPWPRPTDPNRCWWCNFAGPTSGIPRLCKGCEAHLKEF